MEMQSCGKTFMNHSSLTRHKKCHTEDKPREHLKYCEKVCISGSSQKDVDIEDQEKNQGRKFRSTMIESLSEIKDISSGREDFNLISMCNLKKNTDLKPLDCTAYGKTYMHHSSLTRHKKCHIEDKPREPQKCPEKVYKCEECGKTFVSPSDLRTHERSYTGEKPYECYECGKVFPYQKSF